MSPPPAEQFAARIFMGPALRAQPDRRLVDLVRDGYDAAFEEIVRRYRRPLDRFAAAFVGHRSEDVTQDSFSKALPALRQSSAEIDLRPWLYRIVRNTALNDLRAAAPAAAELSETLPGARSAAAEVERREELRDLMERLQALPETQRAALVMRELEGLSHEEIAAALGVSGGAARQAIFRARAALREGFGLLVPLPLLRVLVDHGGEAGAASAGVALGGGALKAGMATVLIAGAVGAGVAVQDHHGRADGPEAAEAAPLTGGKHPGSDGERAAAEQSSFSTSENKWAQNRPSGGGRDAKRSGSGDGGSGSLSNGDRSGPSGIGSSGDSSRSGSTSRSDSGSGGPGSSSNSGSGDVSGPGGRHGGHSGSDDGGGGSGSSGASDDSSGGGSGDSGSSGSSGSDDGLVSSGSSGSGSGEVEGEPTTTSEPAFSDNSGSGDSGSGGSGSDDGSETTSGTGDSGDLSGITSTSGSDGNP